MIVIDGSQGEGGGQVLRTALGLSLVTGQAFRIENIRARRPKPGLQRQHLTAVEAAASIGSAEVEGAGLGAMWLEFRPGKVHGGEYHFNVGTAGSTTLVLQTILPALLRAEQPSALVLEGGTHNPLAPPFDFLDRAFLPLLRRMGGRVEAKLDRPGFYPAGGGKMRVRIEPVAHLEPIELLERGEIRHCRARAVVAHLPELIAERELAVVRRALGWSRAQCAVERADRSHGPGNVLILEIASDALTEVFTGFGRRGVRAEIVAQEVVEDARSYLESPAPVGPHLADQLVIPLALAGGGRFRTIEPTGHLRTNLDVVQTFLPVEFELRDLGDRSWLVGVQATRST